MGRSGGSTVSKASYGEIVVTVVGREVVGMGDRPSLIYECECGVKGTQGQMVRHLREDDGHQYTEISRRLAVARSAWGKHEREEAAWLKWNAEIARNKNRDTSTAG